MQTHGPGISTTPISVVAVMGFYIICWLGKGVYQFFKTVGKIPLLYY